MTVLNSSTTYKHTLEQTHTHPLTHIVTYTSYTHIHVHTYMYTHTHTRTHYKLIHTTINTLESVQLCCSLHCNDYHKQTRESTYYVTRSQKKTSESQPGLLHLLYTTHLIPFVPITVHHTHTHNKAIPDTLSVLHLSPAMFT